MNKLAVIGSPIQHSLSPLIHNYWLQQNNIAANYAAVDVAPNDLEQFCTSLKDGQWRGCNVTIPHKKDVMAFLDEVNGNAARIGAVNTIVNHHGALRGYNTDGFGFVSHLKHELPDFDFTKPVMMLGAGGAARGILDALIEHGARQLTIVNRDRDKAGKLQQDFGHLTDIKVTGWPVDPGRLPSAHLLVNTTSLGMTGQQPLDFDVSHLPKHAVVYDIVYKPLETELLKQARAAGLKTIDGLGMLIHQARQSFYHWFGILPDVSDELYQNLSKVI